MKRTCTFLAGVVVGALVFGTAAGLLAYSLGHPEPIVVVRNLTQAVIDVRIRTDIGESYEFNDVEPLGSRRTRISGRDKELWVTSATSTGETLKSQEIYVTSQGAVFVAITEQSITIDYEL